MVYCVYVDDTNYIDTGVLLDKRHRYTMAS